MGPMARKEYLRVMRVRYQQAQTKAEKGQILDEICATCGFHRKHATRAMRPPKQQKKGGKKSGRKAVYDSPELLKVLRTIWLAANLPCSKRLRAILPIWLPGYEAYYSALSPDVREKLLRISPATIDRVLCPTRLEHTQRGRCTTKPGLLRSQIPVQTGQWKETRPGFIEGDTVAHCGGSMAGHFASTLDCVDIATGWTEQRAVWRNLAEEVVTQMKSIESMLPFPLRGFDSDNGSEFHNHLLIAHFIDRKEPVKMTRGRAYKKNDNAHIEQKNWTHVRQWLGYRRIENPKAVPLLNEMYTAEWRLFHNFFCPSVKLLSKERKGSKTIKHHDDPKTPYQRILESDRISDYAKRGLTHIYENTNPFVLRQAIERRLKLIFKIC